MCARYKEQENEIFRRLRLSLLGSRGVELGRADLRSSSNGKGRDKKVFVRWRVVLGLDGSTNQISLFRV